MIADAGRFLAIAVVAALAALLPAACGKQEPRPVTAADVNKAFDDAFAGKKTATVGDTELAFTGKQLVPVGGTVYALISEGSANAEDACHACTGALRVTYMTREGDSFTPLQPPKQVDLPGNGFGAPPSWKIGKDGSFPAIIVETGFTAQGCTELDTAVYRITSDGLAENKAAAKHETDGC